VAPDLQGSLARLAAIRRHEIHRLTTRLATTHGRIAGEGLDVTGMLRQQGLPGARARRRGLADAALAEVRRQLRDKTGWGSPSGRVPMGRPFVGSLVGPGPPGPAARKREPREGSPRSHSVGRPARGTP